MFSDDELIRYSRHFSVSKIGMPGQARLKNASVLCVGAGGIGSPVALYLAASGIGKITIIDHDRVELSNLQRQILFTENEQGEKKALLAEKKLKALNSRVKIEAICDRLSIDNIEKIIQSHDVVIDGSDNYETRYLVADACAAAKKTLISASIYQFSGQLIVLDHASSPCYRCLYPQRPGEGVVPNCAEAGVLGTVPGVLGTLAATEAIKHLLDLPEKMTNAFLHIDLLSMSLKRYSISPRPQCPICDKLVSMQRLYRQENVSDDPTVQSISCETFAQWQKENRPYTLVDVRQDWERDIVKINADVHIPLSELDYYDCTTLTTPVVFYCKSGVRSYHAAVKCLSQGVSPAYNLEGGVVAWAQRIETDKQVY